MELNVDEGVLMPCCSCTWLPVPDSISKVVRTIGRFEHEDGDEKSPGCHPEPWTLHGGLFVLYSGEYEPLLSSN
jgi:hypothetical protein